MTESDERAFGGIDSVDDVGDGGREAVVEELAEVCDEKLPRMAASGQWPVTFGHCFRRLAYDAACRGQWYDHVDGESFVEDASDDQLGDALYHAVAMMYKGHEYAWELQEKSMVWRGEMEAEECEYAEVGAL